MTSTGTARARASPQPRGNRKSKTRGGRSRAQRRPQTRTSPQRPAIARNMIRRVDSLGLRRPIDCLCSGTEGGLLAANDGKKKRIGLTRCKITLRFRVRSNAAKLARPSTSASRPSAAPIGNNRGYTRHHGATAYCPLTSNSEWRSARPISHSAEAASFIPGTSLRVVVKLCDRIKMSRWKRKSTWFYFLSTAPLLTKAGVDRHHHLEHCRRSLA